MAPRTLTIAIPLEGFVKTTFMTLLSEAIMFFSPPPVRVQAGIKLGRTTAFPSRFPRGVFRFTPRNCPRDGKFQFFSNSPRRARMLFNLGKLCGDGVSVYSTPSKLSCQVGRKTARKTDCPGNGTRKKPMRQHSSGSTNFPIKSKKKKHFPNPWMFPRLFARVNYSVRGAVFCERANRNVQ